MSAPKTIVAGVVAMLAAVMTSADVAVAALFSSSVDRASGALSTATLQPVSNVAVTWWCPSGPGHGFGRGSGGGGSVGGGYTATIAWDPSSSSFAQSYVVEWASSADGPWRVLATTTSTAVQQTSIPRKTDRWWRVGAASYEWRSAAVSVAATAPNPQC